jgi:hypothetical protein
MLSYWRSPSYNFARMVVSIIIALIFSSTYANQSYTQQTDAIARTAVIYVTVLFCGVVGNGHVIQSFLSDFKSWFRPKYCDFSCLLRSASILSRAKFGSVRCCAIHRCSHFSGGERLRQLPSSVCLHYSTDLILLFFLYELFMTSFKAVTRHELPSSYCLSILLFKQAHSILMVVVRCSNWAFFAVALFIIVLDLVRYPVLFHRGLR